MESKIRAYVEENKESLLALLKTLCGIPAPSHHEERRAEFCKQWLEAAGAEGVYIDEALNVVFPLNCDGSNEITVYVAHTDTVFPDMEPMPYEDDGTYIRCPGAGDDTASLAVLMLMAKFFVENGIRPKKGILFVCNSCEEGLGNLKGTKQLFRDFEGRIGQFISFDSKLGRGADHCVGSHRYEVEALTKGGHSFGAFGNENAIHALAKIITQIYQIQVPVKEGCKTTYNVGNVSGGTSVNTIAQSAKMLCEYRSNDKQCLQYMKEQFEGIFAENQTDAVKLNISVVGQRPCEDIAWEKVEALKAVIEPAMVSVVGKPIVWGISSTDCNIPLSMGIPALCIGVYFGDGTHTREEWVEKASMPVGLELAIKVALELEA